MNIFISNLRSEWLRKKRSLASWLVIIGGIFIPLLSTIAAITYPKETIGKYDPKLFWQFLYNNNIQFMAFFLLPMGMILATSLITQLEHKNNGWKLVHAMPLSYATIFFGKLALILIMMIQFFLLLNVCIWLSGVVPILISSDLSYPAGSFPFDYYAKHSLNYFIALLPVVTLQYILGILFKNFLVPLGVGIALFVCGLFAMQWEYAYTIPYIYAPLNYLQQTGSAIKLPMSLSALCLVWFIIITMAGYFLYIWKKDKS